MKGFTISTANGPAVSVCHAHGALISAAAGAGRLLLKAKVKCATCGYRQVDSATLLEFLQAVGKVLLSSLDSGSPLSLTERQKEWAPRAMLVLMDACRELKTLDAVEVEILDDWTYCETHR